MVLIKPERERPGRAFTIRLTMTCSIRAPGELAGRALRPRDELTRYKDCTPDKWSRSSGIQRREWSRATSPYYDGFPSWCT